MEFIESLLQSASYFGIIKQMMALSSTDIAVLFLVSKPAFIMVAGLAVLTARNKNEAPQLPDEDPPELLGDR